MNSVLQTGVSVSWHRMGESVSHSKQATPFSVSYLCSQTFAIGLPNICRYVAELMKKIIKTYPGLTSLISAFLTRFFVTAFNNLAPVITVRHAKSSCTHYTRTVHNESILMQTITITTMINCPLYRFVLLLIIERLLQQIGDTSFFCHNFRVGWWRVVLVLRCPW